MATVPRKIGGSTPNGAGRVGRKRHDPDTSTYSGRIADRVRSLRESKRLTVEALADKSGIGLKALYAYESGTRTIPPDVYPALARALGCKTAADFFPPLK
jgi:ribosome-binding protein aMBF1 (putative translation factor)